MKWKLSEIYNVAWQIRIQMSLAIEMNWNSDGLIFGQNILEFYTLVEKRYFTETEFFDCHISEVICFWSKCASMQWSAKLSCLFFKTFCLPCRGCQKICFWDICTYVVSIFFLQMPSNGHIILQRKQKNTAVSKSERKREMMVMAITIIAMTTIIMTTIITIIMSSSLPFCTLSPSITVNLKLIHLGRSFTQLPQKFSPFPKTFTHQPNTIEIYTSSLKLDHISPKL